MSARIIYPPRPDCAAALLRAFAAGKAHGTPDRLRYLAEPFYKVMADGRTWTFAGDGQAFIWVSARVRGFRDYEFPQAGEDCPSVPGAIAAWRDAPHFDRSPLSGPPGPRAREVFALGQTMRATVRRADLSKLWLLDSCRIGEGGGGVSGFPGYFSQAKSVAFQGLFGSLKCRGVVFCLPPSP